MTSIAHIAAFAAGFLLIGALLDAGISDLRAYRIADRDWMVVVLAFIVLAAPAWPLPVIAWHVGAALTVFAVGAVLFALGVWGGGDVKLCAALALMTGFSDLSRFVLVMAIVGGVIAAAILLTRGRDGDRRVPYGLAIAAGGLDWIWTSLLPQTMV